LGHISGREAGLLAQETGLNRSEIPEICVGDFTCIKRPVVDALADPLNLPLEKCLGEMVGLDKIETQDKWEMRAMQDGFVPIGGTTPQTWDRLKYIKLYLVCQALELL
jgi:hypothetical protein